MPHHFQFLFATLAFPRVIGALENSSHLRFQRRYSVENTTTILDDSGLTKTSTISTELLTITTSLSAYSSGTSSATALPTISIQVGPPRLSNQHSMLSGSSSTINQITSAKAEPCVPGQHSLPASIASGIRNTQNASISTASPHHGACSSFLTTCPGQVYAIVTSTILLTNGTITIAAGAPTPPPILIQPLPFCGNVTSRSCPTPGCPASVNIVGVSPKLIGETTAQLQLTVLVTKKSPAVVTASDPPVSLRFDPHPQQTITKPRGSESTSIPVPVPKEKDPNTSEVSTRITSSFVTGEIFLPTSTRVDLPPPGQSGSGDASIVPASRLAGIASAIAAPFSNILNAPSYANPAVPVPSEIAAAEIPISVAPSQVVVDSDAFVAGAPLTTATINGQANTMKPPQTVSHGTTVPLPVFLMAMGSSISPPTLSAVTVGSITFSIGPSAAIIGHSTYLLAPGDHPLTTVVDGQTIRVGANGIGFASTTVAIPTVQALPTLSPVEADGLKIDIGSNEAIISGTTYAIGSGVTPQTVVIGTETFKFGPDGVVLPATTIPPSDPPTFPSPVVVDGLTFSIDATQAIISGTTYAIGPGAALKTAVFGTETIRPGPGGVELPLTTLIPPSLPSVTPTPVIADGLTFSIEPTEVFIGGSTYAIGSGAPTKTLVIAGKSVVIGPDGVVLPSTTIAPPGLPSVRPTPVTADGLTFSIEPHEVIIGGSTYAIGSGAPTETLVLSGKTVIIGPDGVALPSTTITPPRLSSIIPTPVIADGLTFSIEPSDVILGGSTYAIGSGAPSETLVISGETVIIGPGGVALPSTTITPPNLPSITPTPVIADGLTFSIEPSDVILGGSTYAIGSGAPTETLVVSGETIIIGPSGVIMPSTTIVPLGPASTELSSLNGAAAFSRPVLGLVGSLVFFSLGAIIL